MRRQKLTHVLRLGCRNDLVVGKHHMNHVAMMGMTLLQNDSLSDRVIIVTIVELS